MRAPSPSLLEMTRNTPGTLSSDSLTISEFSGKQNAFS
jgi:hypothetical protein